jgi:hypothetical protein
MDSSPENFESLQKLLRLKRYEQPPPRYFNEFSGNVIARIRAGHSRTPRWWERFGFDLRPALTLGAGVAACGLLFATVASALNEDVQVQAAMPTFGSLTPVAASTTPAPAEPLFYSREQGNAASMTPVINPAGTMMLDSWRARVRPASFQVSH